MDIIRIVDSALIHSYFRNLPLASTQFLKLLNLSLTLLDKQKVETIMNVKKPSNLTELRSFLGACNFFRIFVPEFAFVIWWFVATMVPLARELQNRPHTPSRQSQARLARVNGYPMRVLSDDRR